MVMRKGQNNVLRALGESFFFFSFCFGLLVIRCQVNEDANNKFSESKDRSSKWPRNISEKRMFGKNVRGLSKLVTRVLLNPHK